MSSKVIKPLILIIITILIIGMVTACSTYTISNSNNGFNLLTVNKGIAKFSLEFSDKYQISNNERSDSFSRFDLDVPYTGIAQDFTFISISISKLEAGQSSYLCYLEDSLRLDKNLPDIKILERFPVPISGESGEEVIYYYNKPRLPEQIALGIPSAPTIVRRLMFTHNNLLWRLEIRGLESSAEQDKADFELVVQTFKILN